jgi:hypothetical protein
MQVNGAISIEPARQGELVMNRTHQNRPIFMAAVLTALALILGGGLLLVSGIWSGPDIFASESQSATAPAGGATTQPPSVTLDKQIVPLTPSANLNLRANQGQPLYLGESEHEHQINQSSNRGVYDDD